MCSFKKSISKNAVKKEMQENKISTKRLTF